MMSALPALALASSCALLALSPAAVAEEGTGGGPYVRARVPHPGSDQIYWVPTFAQAERMAKDTGRLVLVMGSVSDFSGY